MLLARAAIGGVPLLLVLFFIARQRVDWTVLVVGLAWRTWVPDQGCY
jgi:hypothetical protein